MRVWVPVGLRARPFTNQASPYIFVVVMLGVVQIIFPAVDAGSQGCETTLPGTG